MSGEHSPKSPVNPTGEDDKDKTRMVMVNLKMKSKMSQAAQKARTRKTRMKKTTRNQVMMSCHIENGRHGRRSKN